MEDVVKELLDMLAGVGEIVERWVADPGRAMLVVMITWILWPTPLDALLATALLVAAYYRATGRKGCSEEELREKLSRMGEPALLLVGALLLVVGTYLLIGRLIAIPWEFSLIVVGAFLIATGVALGGRSGE